MNNLKDLIDRKEYLFKQLATLKDTVDGAIEGEEYDLASLLCRQAADVLTILNDVANKIADMED